MGRPALLTEKFYLEEQAHCTRDIVLLILNDYVPLRTLEKEKIKKIDDELFILLLRRFRNIAEKVKGE